jgi:hypothetical protein
MVSGIGPRKLILLILREVSSIKFPINGDRKPSYLAASRSIAIIRLADLSVGSV